MRYLSEVFHPVSMQHAKDIVLTPDANKPNKFEEETKYLINAIEKENILDHTKIVLDFGCGMGRNSKEIIERFNCNVFGTDIDINMLKFATIHVDNPKLFVTCNRVNGQNCFDMALACFVLQHVENPLQEINYIHSMLKPGGYFVLVNDPNTRFVPGGIREEDSSVIWYNDKIDIFHAVERKFKKVKSVPYGDNYHEIIFYQKD